MNRTKPSVDKEPEAQKPTVQPLRWTPGRFIRSGDLIAYVGSLEVGRIKICRYSLSISRIGVKDTYCFGDTPTDEAKAMIEENWLRILDKITADPEKL